jgi:PHD/YefM family antitoxin component YafN of YafNO toxin-antitoxin module
MGSGLKVIDRRNEHEEYCADDLSKYLRLAVKENVVITRHGKPAGILIGFESEDDWFDFRLENNPRFHDRIAKARESLRAGRGIRLEDVKK